MGGTVKERRARLKQPWPVQPLTGHRSERSPISRPSVLPPMRRRRSSSIFRRPRPSAPSVVWSTQSACAIFGAQFPWSTMVLDEALATGAGGPCRVPGVPGKTLHVPQAALVARRLRTCLRVRQSAQAGRRRACGRDRGAACARHGAGGECERQGAHRGDHRGRRGDVPDRRRDAAFARAHRLPRARHDRPVRVGGCLRVAYGSFRACRPRMRSGSRARSRAGCWRSQRRARAEW